MQAKIQMAPGRVLCVSDACQGVFAPFSLASTQRYHHRRFRPLRRSIRPVHLGTARFKLRATQLLREPTTVCSNLEGSLQASKEEAVTRRAIDSSILLQGFGWTSCNQTSWYNQVREKVESIKAAGFTHIYLPPPSKAVDNPGYLPTQLYDLSSRYGTKQELQSLTWALNHAGVKPIADIVINHRCADKEGRPGVYNIYSDDVDHTGPRMDWGAWAICQDDTAFEGTGNPKQGAPYNPAPDLDHSNLQVQLGLIGWLSWLRHEIGFMGWRFDFAKGYPPTYVEQYTKASINEEALHLAEFWVDMRYNGSYMEYDQNAPRQVLCDWISRSGGVAAAFDFPTKGILQVAASHTQWDRMRDRDGKAPGLLGWCPQRACTFIDNHDTGFPQNHWPFPDHWLGAGYAYILTHPGIPCATWDHMWNPHLTDLLRKLMAMRKRQDLHAGSHLEILCAQWNMYIARIDGRVVVKLGPHGDMGSLLPLESDGWFVCTTGHEFAVWEKMSTPAQWNHQ